jgi:hypothetical protein
LRRRCHRKLVITASYFGDDRDMLTMITGQEIAHRVGTCGTGNTALSFAGNRLRGLRVDGIRVVQISAMVTTPSTNIATVCAIVEHAVDFIGIEMTVSTTGSASPEESRSSPQWGVDDGRGA